MTRIIPNENTFLAFLPTVAAATLVPTTAEIAGGTDLTRFMMGINASSTGNVVPTPSFDTLFETSIIGTSQATFTADFYRDDVTDLAWVTLARKTKGYFVLSRFGGKGIKGKVVVADKVEVWPVYVVSRTAGQMSNNAVQTFSIIASINVEPNESATLIT